MQPAQDRPSVLSVGSENLEIYLAQPAAKPVEKEGTASCQGSKTRPLHACDAQLTSPSLAQEQLGFKVVKRAKMALYLCALEVSLQLASSAQLDTSLRNTARRSLNCHQQVCLHLSSCKNLESLMYTQAASSPFGLGSTPMPWKARLPALLVRGGHTQSRANRHASLAQLKPFPHLALIRVCPVQAQPYVHAD